MIDLIRNEKPGQLKALECFYEAGNDLKEGYKLYMNSGDVGLSFKGYRDLAVKNNWIQRVNSFREKESLRMNQNKRFKQLENECTAEEVAKVLYLSCLEQFELLQSELTHRDIGKYLDIANNITKKDKDPMVVVNQAQSQGVVEVDSETLRELGKKMVTDYDSDFD